jgi:hypothetical protein
MTASYAFFLKPLITPNAAGALIRETARNREREITATKPLNAVIGSTPAAADGKRKHLRREPEALCLPPSVVKTFLLTNAKRLCYL